MVGAVVIQGLRPRPADLGGLAGRREDDEIWTIPYTGCGLGSWATSWSRGTAEFLSGESENAGPR